MNAGVNPMSETFPTTRRAALRSANRAGRKLYFQPETGPAGDVLLFIFLRGAMDGLHTVPSYAQPTTGTARRWAYPTRANRTESSTWTASSVCTPA
jgi:uncharacterized protein (DUF1501 family)